MIMKKQLLRLLAILCVIIMLIPISSCSGNNSNQGQSGDNGSNINLEEFPTSIMYVENSNGQSNVKEYSTRSKNVKTLLSVDTRPESGFASRGDIFSFYSSDNAIIYKTYEGSDPITAYGIWVFDRNSGKTKQIKGEYSYWSFLSEEQFSSGDVLFGTEEGGIFRVSTDGKLSWIVKGGLGKVIGKGNDWIYYAIQDYEQYNSIIYKMSSAGKIETALNADIWTDTAQVFDNWIVYSPRSGAGIVAYDEIEKATHSLDLSINDVVYANEKGIFYFDRNDNALHLASIDGSEDQIIYDQSATSFVFRENWIYFLNPNDSNKLYRITTNGTDLVKVIDVSVDGMYRLNFDKVTDDNTANLEIPNNQTPTEENKAIIVIPGAMGSRLFSSPSTFDNNTVVWPPYVTVGGFLFGSDASSIAALGLKLKDTLHVRPPENQHDSLDREYGAQAVYKEVVEKLCDEFDCPIYVFSYDWRKDVADSSEKLNIFINSLIEQENIDRVDLVCHSMGGMVASKYYCQYGYYNKKIDKIITAGTPYEGAPTIINVVQNWDVLGGKGILNYDSFGDIGDDLTDFLLGSYGLMDKYVKREFVSVAELTPTKNYVERQPMWRDSWKPFNIGDYKIDYNSYIEILKKILPQENVDIAVAFQKSLLDKSGYNALLKYPNAYFSIGINQKTICAIKFQYSNVDIDKKMYESDLGYEIKGDGTVPFLSASISEQILKLPEDRWNVFSTTHGGAIGHHEKENKAYMSINNAADQSLSWIIDVLKTESLYTDKYDFIEKGYYVARIACPVDVSISYDGETLQYSSAAQNYSTQTSFGRMDVVGLNDEIKMFCIDENFDYDVFIEGTGQGTMDFELRVFNGRGKQISEYAVYDVPIDKKTVIKTTIDLNNLYLDIDNDGDGIADSNIRLKKQIPKSMNSSFANTLVIVFAFIGIISIIGIAILVIRKRKSTKTA